MVKAELKNIKLFVEFLSVASNRFAEILGVFQEAIPRLRGKRLRQNRIMSYEFPPKGCFFACTHNSKRCQSAAHIGSERVDKLSCRGI